MGHGPPSVPLAEEIIYGKIEYISILSFLWINKFERIILGVVQSNTPREMDSNVSSI